MEQLVIKDKYDPNKYIDATGSVIVAKGGDGTLLRAITKFRHLDKPFFGVAAGTENFLMNPASNLDIFDDAEYIEFQLIKVTVTYLRDTIKAGWIHQEETTKTYQAFNDIMIGGDMNSWIHFNVHDKDRLIGRVKGGGLIFSTAQGSTGINKNNGGVILPLSSHNWVVTGDKTHRRVNYVLEPSRTTITLKSRKPVSLWVDGSSHIISDVLSVEIAAGDTVTVIFNDYTDFKQKRKL